MNVNYVVYYKQMHQKGINQFRSGLELCQDECQLKHFHEHDT